MYVSLRCFHDSNRWRFIHYAHYVQNPWKDMLKITKNLVSFISLGGEKLQNKWKTHVYLNFNFFLFFIIFELFRERFITCSYFFRFSIMHFFMKKIQDPYSKNTIDEKKKGSRETHPTFFNIKTLLLLNWDQ